MTRITQQNPLKGHGSIAAEEIVMVQSDERRYHQNFRNRNSDLSDYDFTKLINQVINKRISSILKARLPNTNQRQVIQRELEMLKLKDNQLKLDYLKYNGLNKNEAKWLLRYFENSQVDSTPPQEFGVRQGFDRNFILHELAVFWRNEILNANHAIDPSSANMPILPEHCQVARSYLELVSHNVPGTISGEAIIPRWKTIKPRLRLFGATEVKVRYTLSHEGRISATIPLVPVNAQDTFMPVVQKPGTENSSLSEAIPSYITLPDYEQVLELE